MTQDEIRLEPAERAGIGNMKYGMLRQAEAETKGDHAGALCPEKLLFLAGAEMDFRTAPCIRKRIAEVAENGLYGFTLPDEAYLSAVRRWMKATRGLDLRPEEIVPTNGTISALNTAVKAFTGPGDGVVIQSPSYYRFDRAVRNHGRHVVYNPMLETNGRYMIDWNDLGEKLSRPENRMLVLCNPHNPTGKVFTEDELRRIAALAARYHTLVFADEIFGELSFVPFHSFLCIASENVIVSTSLGKAFNFTGVNQANLLIRDGTVREKFLSQQTKDHFGSIDPFFYNAMIAAYTPEGMEWIEAVKDRVWSNYRLAVDILAEKAPEITLSPLEGGFMIWTDLRRTGTAPEALPDFLLRDTGIIGDPGSDYGPGGDGFYRFQIAVPEETMREFLRRLTDATSHRLRDAI